MNKLPFVIFMLFVSTFAFGQDNVVEEEPSKWDKIKNHVEFTGYLQAQWNYRTSRDKVSFLDSLGNSTVEKIRVDTVGINTMSGGTFERLVSDKFTLRRGRLGVKIDYEFIESKFSIDVTERGFHVTDMYVKLTEPWKDVASITGGVFVIPFGSELNVSSSKRPFAERSRVIQHLFPSTRDVGFMGSVAVPEGKKGHGLAFDIAVINGARSTLETDKYKDFVGRLYYENEFRDGAIEVGGGFSYYWGGHAHYSDIGLGINQYSIYQGIGRTAGDTAFFMIDEMMTEEAGAQGKRVKKQHFGGDVHVAAKWKGGKTSIGAEVVAGQQAAIMYRNVDPVRMHSATSYSPKGTGLGVSWIAESLPIPSNPATVKAQRLPSNSFIRNFRGGSVYVVHEIMETGLQVAFRYDWYDPNVDIDGEDIRITKSISDNLGLSIADVKFQTFSVGLNYIINDFVTIMANYDIVRNENTSIIGRSRQEPTDDAILPAFTYLNDAPDDVLTLRVQVSW